MHERPPRAPRAEPREIVELKQLREAHPELASAVDMQLALVDMQRRVQSRVPLPWIQADIEWQRAQQAAGKPLVRFSDIPLDWSDFRLTFRQTADILRRFDAIEPADHDKIVALSRDGNALEPLVRGWYVATSGIEDEAGDRSPGAAERSPVPGRGPEGAPPSIDQVLVLAVRPFLARCAEVVMQRTDLSAWRHGHCPCCGWEPDFAVITPSADRRLICGRCAAQWSFGTHTCPFCSNDDRTLITSFATRDGRYRVYACDVCKRYVKAYDGRGAARPVMVSVDSIATLPLDAAAIQKGYIG
jgi:formate dehydrogenase maturation protein FdhE